ncbi:hypothetical protein EYC80_003507 [Monilinia laxa]|uniref:Uncharacterized protein n=1 Tax=Monilinia laxa TaxID=61186 RepID=A0A5N6KDV0_MONLA|nr:hypothetical protein EYC80_003507 [Monilinia laxa]
MIHRTSGSIILPIHGLQFQTIQGPFHRSSFMILWIPNYNTARVHNQAEQSASQASQSIQQANQSASQAAQQASQSASNSIQQANNSASQLIAAASRSSSSAVSSASSAIASIQASASSAVARADGAMQSAQFVASLLQQEFSKAGATAAAANEQIQQSQNVAITATQAALAIVGSIIASTLLTMLVFGCIISYRKKKSEQKKNDRNTIQDDSHLDDTPPIARLRGSEGFHAGKDIFEPEFKEKTSSASSLTPCASYTKAMQEGQTGHRNEPKTKETYLAWNPRDPPKAPRLKSWLQFRVKDGVSPSSNGDPLSLPKSGNSDKKTPLGGQLKSPHSMILMRSPEIPILDSPPDIKSTTLNRDQIILPQNHEETDPESKDKIQDRDRLSANTRKEILWTDEMRSTIAREESPLQPQSLELVFPEHEQPVRNTEEWFLEQQKQQQQQQKDRLKTPTQSQNFLRDSLLKDINSPSTARASKFNGLPKTPKLGVSVSIKSMKGEVHYVNSVKGVKRAVYGLQSSRKNARNGDEGQRLDGMWNGR